MGYAQEQCLSRRVVDYVLDTSLLLGGKEPPRGGQWLTTPEAAAEVKPGGRDARRFEDWRSLGLEVRSPKDEHLDRVDEAAIQAGSLGRLSEADRTLLALAKQFNATLVTDDYTMLDVASRLDVMTRTVNQDGPNGTMDWALRCIGCNRTYEASPRGDECIICGSPVKLKRA